MIPATSSLQRRRPDVSVLLPARDAGRTIAAALDSVLASRDVSLEVICVDDGSRDGTSRVLADRARRDPRVRGVRTEPLGLVRALNRGLAEARAQLVARMDADDEMHPDRLAAQYAFLRERPEIDLVGCQVESFRDPREGGELGEGYRLYTEWVNGLVEPRAIAREAFVECPIPHPTWLFRADRIRALGGYRDRGWPEDLDLIYRLLATGGRLAKLPRVLHRWRDHAKRLSRSDPSYQRESFARAKAHFIRPVLRQVLDPYEGAALHQVVVWGAGRTGRRFVRLLEAEGIHTRALIDIRPDRIGSSWHEIPIFGPQDLPRQLGPWRSLGLPILGAVASRGARSEIRSALGSHGLVEGRHFVMVA